MMTCFKMLHAKNTKKKKEKLPKRTSRQKKIIEQKELKKELEKRRFEEYNNRLEEERKAEKKRQEKNRLGVPNEGSVESKKLSEADKEEIRKILLQNPKAAKSEEELRKSQQFIEFKDNNIKYLKLLYQELVKRKERLSKGNNFLTQADVIELKQLYGENAKKLIEDLNEYALNLRKLSILENKLLSAGVPTKNPLEYTQDGFLLNDAITYLSCNSFFSQGKGSGKSDDCDSINDLYKLGLIMPIFSVGSEETALQVKDNIVQIDTKKRYNFKKSELTSGKITTSIDQISIDNDLQNAIKENQKVLFFVASGNGRVSSYTGGLLSPGGHASLFIILESGKLFSFGLSTHNGGQTRLLGLAFSGTAIFLSSPDELYINKKFPQKVLSEIELDIGKGGEYDPKMRIADMGQLNQVHLDRIMELIRNDGEKTEIKTYSKKTRKGNSRYDQSLWTIRNVLGKEKRVYDNLSTLPNSLNCAALMAYIFRERLTCKNLSANIGINVPSRCRRMNRSTYLEKDDVWDILQEFISKRSTQAFIEKTKVLNDNLKYNEMNKKMDDEEMDDEEMDDDEEMSNMLYLKLKF